MIFGLIGISEKISQRVCIFARSVSMQMGFYQAHFVETEQHIDVNALLLFRFENNTKQWRFRLSEAECKSANIQVKLEALASYALNDFEAYPHYISFLTVRLRRRQPFWQRPWSHRKPHN